MSRLRKMSVKRSFPSPSPLPPDDSGVDADDEDDPVYFDFDAEEPPEKEKEMGGVPRRRPSESSSLAPDDPARAAIHRIAKLKEKKNKEKKFRSRFASLPSEIKILIWQQAILEAEQALQFELRFQAPQDGGLTVRAFEQQMPPSPPCPMWGGTGGLGRARGRLRRRGNRQQEQQQQQQWTQSEAARRQRMRGFALQLGREALTAVRDLYVALPRHPICGRAKAAAAATAPSITWVCPALDQFCFLAATTEACPLRGHRRREPARRYLSIQDFLAIAPRRPPPSHEVVVVVAEEGGPLPPQPVHYEDEDTERVLNAVQHLVMTLPAFAGKRRHNMEVGLLGVEAGAEAGAGALVFPHLATVTLATSIPSQIDSEPSHLNVLRGIDFQRKQKAYAACNDRLVKAALRQVLERRFGDDIMRRQQQQHDDGGAVIPQAAAGWGHYYPPWWPLSTSELLLVYMQQVATQMMVWYRMGRPEWLGFLQLHNRLVARGIRVSMISGHNSNIGNP